jgi:ATP-dependent Clp protease adaptor protein ClpS
LILRQLSDSLHFQKRALIFIPMPIRIDRVKLSDPDEPQGPQGPDNGGNGLDLATKTQVRTKKPSMYRVLILNDDYTPMEFVVLILERFFQKNREQATRIMLHVHQKGVGVCGVYTYEVAETKVAQVMDLARRNEHPLQCTMEKED